MRKFLSEKVWGKKNSQQKKPQSIVFMESDTLGMTVIEEDTSSLSFIQPLTAEQWVDIISQGKLNGYPYSRIYFSFLKGLPDYMRMKIWLFLVKDMCNLQYRPNPNLEKQQSNQLKSRSIRISWQELSALSTASYVDLANKKPAKKQHEQIEKDIHRSYTGREKYQYTQQLLRRILYAVSNWGIQYSQGMNFILLNVIIYCLQSLDLDETSYQKLTDKLERDIFIIMVGIVSQMEQTFGNNNIFKVIKDLEEKIAESEPEILYLIYGLGMDCFSCFSQYYYSVMSYNEPPQQLCKYMMDLFFLEGERAITSMIVRMLEICHEQIIKIKNPEDLQRFMKKEIFHYCYKTFKENQATAKKLQDFGMSFYNNLQQF